MDKEQRFVITELMWISPEDAMQDEMSGPVFFNDLTRVRDKMLIAEDGLPTTGFLRLAGVLAVVTLGKSTVYDWIGKGKFPKPVKLGTRTSAWRVEDVRAFIANPNGFIQ